MQTIVITNVATHTNTSHEGKDIRSCLAALTNLGYRIKPGDGEFEAWQGGALCYVISTLC